MDELWYLIHVGFCGRPCKDYWPINTLRCQDNDDDCSNSFQEQLNLCQSNSCFFFVWLSILSRKTLNLVVCAYFKAYDQKNIRRRVYDALNVLMAMNIISKEKKEIKWVGLPTNSAQECQQLEVCVEELTLSLKLDSVLDMFAYSKKNHKVIV